MRYKKLKKIIWIASSRKDEIGYAIYRAQEDKKHHKAKSLKGFSGVLEITSSYKTDTYRAVYAIKFGDCIYVLHSFKKKSHKNIKTPKPDMKIMRKRLKKGNRSEVPHILQTP
ncbi:MAG: type II toxin-antitoxin system RelE/ParE family toxin [Thermodesulfobacteriota bacterium]|nr:type II toxin-antitoxin system RelE/ParE family toxin [Thermodesulfobacteriota bacterium]